MKKIIAVLGLLSVTSMAGTYTKVSEIKTVIMNNVGASTALNFNHAGTQFVALTEETDSNNNFSNYTGLFDASGKMLRHLDMPGDATSFRWSSDDSLIASTVYDWADGNEPISTIFSLFSLAKNAVILTSTWDKAKIVDVSADPQNLFGINGWCGLNSWKAEDACLVALTGDDQAPLRYGFRGYSGSLLSPDGAQYAGVAEESPKVTLQTVRGTGPNFEFNCGAPDHSSCGQISWSVDGSLLVVPGADVRLWNARTGALVGAFKNENPKCSSIFRSARLNRDSTRLVAVEDGWGDDQRCQGTFVRVWTVSTGKVRGSFLPFGDHDTNNFNEDAYFGPNGLILNLADGFVNGTNDGAYVSMWQEQ